MDVAQLVLLYLLGIETAFTPCFLPILPIFLNFVARSSKGRVFLSSLFFAAGVTASFVLYGLLATYSSGILRSFLVASLPSIATGLGLLLISIGVVVLSPARVLFSTIPSVQPRFKKTSLVNAFVLGFTFSLVAAPCAATFLVAAFSLVWLGSLNSQNSAMATVLVYASGTSTPFLLIGLFAEKVGKKLSRSFFVRHNETLSGLITISLGVLTVLSVENYDLVSIHVAQHLYPYFVLFSLLPVLAYFTSLLRLGVKVGSLPPTLLASGVLLLGVSDVIRLFQPHPYATVVYIALALASRALVIAGGLLLAKPHVYSVILAVFPQSIVTLDLLMLFSWIAGPGRREREHLFAALFILLHLVTDLQPLVPMDILPVLILLLQPVSYLSILIPASKVSRVLTGLRLLEEV
ncbi:hypothetical protein IG193_06830 [Infirmifilum lucidum]|uniref:Cytochrome C biogenesis protein transmembrane domain-containing protein n=1 Tax=Infirmifilum lucidum TaxID=2776706 RepID=A0A7L9FHT2_9CREN|nr:cytochrome c biogenesis protein CcdA [Infirmifilum lucidum]QOJ78464.1 hypothetical protein IG193_06830 [Infirmifilum lucidum]